MKKCLIVSLVMLYSTSSVGGWGNAVTNYQRAWVIASASVAAAGGILAIGNWKFGGSYSFLCANNATVCCWELAYGGQNGMCFPGVDNCGGGVFCLSAGQDPLKHRADFAWQTNEEYSPIMITASAMGISGAVSFLSSLVVPYFLYRSKEFQALIPPELTAQL